MNQVSRNNFNADLKLFDGSCFNVSGRLLYFVSICRMSESVSGQLLCRRTKLLRFLVLC